MFTARHLYGDSEVVDDLAAIDRLLDELAQADGEHTDVSVGIESGWVIAIYPSNTLVIENPEERTPPRHAQVPALDERLRILRDFAVGGVEAVESTPWLPGYGTKSP